MAPYGLNYKKCCVFYKLNVLIGSRIFKIKEDFFAFFDILSRKDERL